MSAARRPSKAFEDIYRVTFDDDDAAPTRVGPVVRQGAGKMCASIGMDQTVAAGEAPVRRLPGTPPPGSSGVRLSGTAPPGSSGVRLSGTAPPGSSVIPRLSDDFEDGDTRLDPRALFGDGSLHRTARVPPAEHLVGIQGHLLPSEARVPTAVAGSMPPPLAQPARLAPPAVVGAPVVARRSAVAKASGSSRLGARAASTRIEIVALVAAFVAVLALGLGTALYLHVSF